MKIGVVSDTHIPTLVPEIPKALLAGLKGVDMIIHAGDILEIKVIEQLRRVCPDVKAVWGNMDPCEIRKELPEKEVISVGPHRIGVIHGRGHPDGLIDLVTEAFKNQDIDIFIFGHSHRPLNRRDGKKLYFNPGSPTDTIFAEYNSYIIIAIGYQVNAQIIRLG